MKRRPPLFTSSVRFPRLFALSVLLVTQPGIACYSTSSQTQSDAARIERFENQADELRKFLKIPGMSAVIVKNQEVLWAKGFGFADQEKKTPATPDTLYHVASLTKTFASILVMQLVEQGKLDLDEPMSHYSSDFPDDSVKIKHLLSHTSQGTPGDRYNYSGDRYDHLTAVLEKKTGKSFRELMLQTFLDPLKMTASVPSHDVAEDPKWVNLLGNSNIERYRSNLTHLARPYTVYGEDIIQTFYPPKRVGAAAGFLSTVNDMAKFDAAIDRHTFLKKATQDQAWTQFVSNSGQALPHALGWFSENYKGLRLIWHYGHWGTGFSATYLKIPEKNLTLILLANTEALSDPFYQNGGIETNAIACTFLRIFVFEDQQKRALGDPIWTRSSDDFSKELDRLSQQAGGFPYECERVSHTAITNWLRERRGRARTPVKLNPRSLAMLVGKYQWNPQRTFSVTIEGDRLFIDVPRGNISEMFAENETAFFLKVADVRVKFEKVGVRIAGLELTAFGETIKAQRVN